MSQQIGQYKILGELGAGGMGIVYRALDTELQREVALKRLRSEFAASDAVLDRFRNEAKLQGRLNHPNIAQLYSLVQTQDAFCIVMEFVDGLMVKDLLPLEWKHAVDILLRVLDALGYAHSMGVLHRDIKPENILIDRRGTVKVMDFGIAYAVGSQRMTREKSLIGTLEYMSPERILGKPMDGRSDIYALGILFYEILCGRLPFEISNEYDLMRWQLEGAVPLITAVASVPPSLNKVVQRAMSKDPEDRYATCSEMAAHLVSLVPTASAASDTLHALVAAHARPHRQACFDATHCYSNVYKTIASGDLRSAEGLLRSELCRFPQEESLRNYHLVAASALAQLAQSDPAGNASKSWEHPELTLTWMRLISAERTHDRSAYWAELNRLLEDFGDSPIAQLLGDSSAKRSTRP
jgi:serine/threonine protein kinase